MKKFCRKTAILFCVLLLCATSVGAVTTLIPGGEVIGLELLNSSVTVVAFDETLGGAAQKAGILPGDRILKIDETKISDVSDVRSALQKSDGRVRVSVLRKGKTRQLSLCPTATTDGPKLGLYLRQGTAGLGTVTYYNPENNTFGALGHGVNNPQGSLIEMEQGRIYRAGIFSVKAGKAGAPGQLLGSLTQTAATGSLTKNTPQGVFGSCPSPKKQPLPVASASEIQTGRATIYSTVSGEKLQEYSVEILKIYPTGADSRNMLIKITDPALLSATGGIVQGMSGSPIIQNGHLIGAVTHVLVNDPTTGYGIFIENMLDAAA